MAMSAEIRGRALADFRRGWQVSLDELAVATLVTLPFTATLMVFVSQVVPLPDFLIMALTLGVQVLATFWNAGWRARTSE